MRQHYRYILFRIPHRVLFSKNIHDEKICSLYQLIIVKTKNFKSKIFKII